ncbi:MAG: serine--tRNA ligase, partial [Pseudomonadales bacterium]
MLRNEPELIAERLSVRGYQLDVETLNNLEEQRKALQVETESLQAERNKSSKAIGQAKAKGEDVQPLLDAVASLGGRLDEAKAKLESIQEQTTDILEGIPNIPDDAVPQGKSEDDNVEVSRWGEPRQFGFDALDHVELGENLHGMDFEAGAKLTGSRFVV